MSISEDTVRYVAKLGAIALSETEVAQMVGELNEILDYVERLNQVNTLGVSPTSHVHGATNAFRDDIIRDSLSVDDISANAPNFSTGGFRVPKFIG